MRVVLLTALVFIGIFAVACVNSEQAHAGREVNLITLEGRPEIRTANFDRDGSLLVVVQRNRQYQLVRLRSALKRDSQGRNHGLEEVIAKLPWWEHRHSLSKPVTDSKGNIYIADAKSQVLRIDKKGRISVFAGTPNPGLRFDPKDPQKTSLNQPTSVAIDQDDSVYIADLGNHRIHKWSIKEDQSFKGRIIVGDVNGSQGHEIDENSGENTRLWLPHGITIDSKGTLFIVDSSGSRIISASADKIKLLYHSGQRLYPLGQQQIEINPSEIAIGQKDEFYFTDSVTHRCMRLKENNELEVMTDEASYISAAKKRGLPAYDFRPVSIAVGPDGSLLLTNAFGGDRHSLILIPPTDGLQHKIDTHVTLGTKLGISYQAHETEREELYDLASPTQTRMRQVAKGACNFGKNGLQRQVLDKDRIPILIFELPPELQNKIAELCDDPDSILATKQLKVRSALALMGPADYRKSALQLVYTKAARNLKDLHMRARIYSDESLYLDQNFPLKVIIVVFSGLIAYNCVR
jgi:sugar lactone lactonase YvrE